MCVSRLRKVRYSRASRSCGAPLASKPVRRRGDASIGSILPAGSSSFSLPRSTSCIAATEVSSFTMEAMRKIVSVVMRASAAEPREPIAPS